MIIEIMSVLCYNLNADFYRTEVSCLKFHKKKNALLCRILW